MVVEHDREGVELPLIKLADLSDSLLLTPRQKDGIDGIAVLLQALRASGPLPGSAPGTGW